MWGVSKKLIKQFDALTEPYGGRNCSDIARIEWSDRDEVRNFYKKPRKSTRKDCTQLVGDLAFYLGKILEKEMSRLEQK